MVDRNTIKNWFKTGLKPTQSQFWAWIDSYWHKDDEIPQSAIKNLSNVLNAKAETSQFEGHKIDVNAHNELFELKENKDQKGMAYGYAPLNEFTKIPSENLEIVNNLETGGNTNVLSAEQGKQLNLKIEQIEEDVVFKTEKGLALGVATLNSNGKVPLEQIDDFILGNLKWYGIYDGTSISSSILPSLNGQPIPLPSLQNVGWYFIANGDFTMDTLEFKTGDWLISNGVDYSKVDNTDAVSSIAGLVGNVSVENLRSALVNVTSISIQDTNGNEMFKMTDKILFEGMTFNPLDKKLRVEPLVPLSAFLDVVNGNDITAALENSRRPFKSMEALIQALPTFSGETYNIYISGGTVPILRKMPIRNFNFIAYKSTTLDFTNCKDSDGITDSLETLTWLGSVGTWDFKGSNISIVCSYVGSKCFVSGSSTFKKAPIMLGKINVFNWASSTYGVIWGPTFYVGTNLEINELHDSTQARCTVFPSSGLVTLVVNKYITKRKNRFAGIGNELSGGYLDLTIKNIVEEYANSTILTIGTTNYGKFENVTINGEFQPSSSTVEFNGTISSGCTINLIGCNFIRGTLNSTTYCTTAWGGHPVLFENFNGKLRNLLAVTSSSYTFRNCIIELDGLLISNFSSSVTNLLTFEGVNTIKQNNLTADLVTSTYAHTMTITGALTTNMQSFGQKATVNYTTATFKEKLKELVVRSKKDLVNRDLDSTMNYIVDGVITLLPSESIIVPLGGLSLSGYGFDVSAIKATGANSTIFTSPVGGSGNLFIQNLSFEASGVGSKVFNLLNAGAPTGGADAIELGVVNFDNCTSLGVIENFRQGLWDNIGIFGCKDGLEFKGVWSGGFRADLVISRNFGESGVGGTLFKAGADLLFKSRFLTDINADFKPAGSLSNFTSANFFKPKLYQIKAAQITRSGILDDTENYTGSLTAFSLECDWSGNNGMKNSALHPYAITTDKLGVYSDDISAETGGVAIGEVYVESSTGYFKTRLF